MKTEFGNLLIRLDDHKGATLLPINAIKWIEADGFNQVKVQLKPEYCLDKVSGYLIAYGEVAEIQEKINNTIIDAIKKVEEDA